MNTSDPIQRLYFPVYEWCLEQTQNSRPVIIGLNGAQGAGKSTLTRTVCEMLDQKGVRAATISIDDFYLTRADQIRLAKENPDNPYLQNRGYPGTHDLELGTRVLKALRGKTGTVPIPIYEKSLFVGKGDRLPTTSWKEQQLPLDLVFFEGWMLGFRAVDERNIHEPALVEINRRLPAYAQWWRQLDALIQLKPKDYRFAIDWRVEAEERMKASGKTGMTEADARAYVTNFLPAYELYLPTLAVPGFCADLVIEIGLDRLPTAPIRPRGKNV